MILPLFAWLVAGGAIAGAVAGYLVVTGRGGEGMLAIGWLSTVSPWGAVLVLFGPESVAGLIELMFVPGVERESGIPLLWLSPLVAAFLGWATWTSRLHGE